MKYIFTYKIYNCVFFKRVYKYSSIISPNKEFSEITAVDYSYKLYRYHYYFSERDLQFEETEKRAGRWIG